MESSNAILLNMPAKPGDAFTYDDYGVQLGYTCIPETPPPFEYTDIKAFDVEGNLEPPASVEELRKMAELYHRIKMEL